jgi:hypothetical protein
MYLEIDHDTHTVNLQSSPQFHHSSSLLSIQNLDFLLSQYLPSVSLVVVHTQQIQALVLLLHVPPQF